MQIKKFWSKIFRKDIPINTLANLKDLIPFPKRENFKDNEVMLELIDLYKKKYLETISVSKYSIGSDLRPHKLYKELKMNQDLLLRIGLKDDETYIDVFAKNLNEIIDFAKLNLYYEQIISLELETKARIMALNEIMHEKLFLFKGRKNEISNVINNLYVTLMIYESGKEYIENKRVSITLQNKLYNLKKEELTEKDLTYLQGKVKELKNLSQIFATSPNLDLTSGNLIHNLGKIERDLEIYAYENKDDILSLKKEVQEIESICEDFSNQKGLLGQLEILILKFKIIKKYGYNEISEEDLKRLYKIKFNILINDRSPLINPFLNDDMDEFEISCYEEFLAKEIEVIIQGNNIVVLELFQNNCIKAISVLEDVLKVNGIYNYRAILQDKLLLNLLFSFDTKEGFENFLNNYFVKKEEFDLSKLNRIVELQEMVPLKILEYLPLPSYKYISDLISLIYSKEKDSIYLPEGLKKISITNIIARGIFKKQFKIDDSFYLDKIVMPSTLEELRNEETFFNTRNIIYNEGLTTLDNKVDSFSNIFLPSTLKDFEAEQFRDYNIQNIIINNYEDAYIINNFKCLMYFLESIVKIEPLNKTQVSLNKENISYQKILNNDYLGKKSYKYQYRVTLKKNIILKSKFGDSIIISKDNFKYYFDSIISSEINDTEYLGMGPYYSELENVARLFLERIPKKTLRRQ